MTVVCVEAGPPMTTVMVLINIFVIRIILPFSLHGKRIGSNPFDLPRDGGSSPRSTP